MENKENNIPSDIDSGNEIDIKSQKEGISAISPVKKAILFVTGVGGIYLIALICGLIFHFTSLSKIEQSGASTFLTYAILLAALFGILNIDIKRFKFDIVKWQGWLIGIAIGIFMICFPMIYTTIISTFYEYTISDNEQSLRDIIAIYPVLSVIFFGLIGPLCEELTYRVGLFGLLSKIKWVAYLVSILVFALMHFGFTSANIIDEFVNLPIYLFSGACLAFAYDKFGISASLCAHVVNNLYAVIAVIATQGA